MVRDRDLVAASPLRGLASALDTVEVVGDADDVTIDDLAYDSRDVAAGTLFFCLPGANVDGHDHAAAAVAAGAVALVCERALDLGVPELRVPDSRRAMARLAARHFGDPATALDLVGITGTNGKTTTARMVASIADAAGVEAATIGTLSGVRTTPEAPDLQRQLAALRAAGVSMVALEVSSHALAQHRVDDVVFDVAVFTNLSRDHLDFHGTMQAYFEAKASLFAPERARSAVVNVDDPHGRLLLDTAQVPTVASSLVDARDLQVGVQSSTFTWRDQRVVLPIGGRFNVSNALLAAAAAVRLGVPDEAIARGLSALGPVDGRFEPVDLDAEYRVIVDFAHTPDGLDHLLIAGREVVGEGRIHLVFGCGGDKDRTKREPMGAVASAGADHVIVTSDNPRSEDPIAIIDQIRSGIPRTAGIDVEPDRRRAIALALRSAEPGDLVLVAGKGHETVQIIGDDLIPFVDRDVVVEEHHRLREAST
ncbi:MAG: UDP-N-acetylmuramoyl-L-alanyl-D-glutamate--2,6-diaminopimelate ligase [Acidimicrobiales bacterium]